MKKLLFSLSIAAFLGAACLGGALATKKQAVSEVKATTAADTEERYVPTDTFSVLHASEGKNIGDLLRGRNERFWWGNPDPNNWDSQERTFNGMDSFADTIHKAGGEGWTGAIQSPTQTVTDNSRRYISFLFGGGAEEAGKGKIFINIWSPSLNKDVVVDLRPKFDGSGTFDDKDAKFNAPVTCNMVFFYLELPEELKLNDTYAVYVKDEKTSSFGGFTFGSLFVNQKLEDVARHFSAHKAQMKLNEFTSDWNRNANEYVINTIYADSYYDAVRAKEVELADADTGFETNYRLADWAYDQNESRAGNDVDLISIDYSNIYSSADVKANFTERMPMNKTGNMFLNGDTSGVAEDCRYKIVSSAFKLSGTGLVSVKMGGKSTRISLLRADTLAELAHVDNPGFNDPSGGVSNIATSGCRCNTMARTYIDWSAYLYSTVGYQVRIALSDYRVGGDWGLSYFDELITRYDTLPGLPIDRVEQQYGENPTYYCEVPNFYVGSDETDFGVAFNFVHDYLETARSGDTNACSVANSNAMKALYTRYSELSANALAVVNASVDYNHITEGNWYETKSTITGEGEGNNYVGTVGQNVAYLSQFSASTSNSFRLLDSINSDSNITMIIVISAIAVVSCVFVVAVYRRKKLHK